MTANCPVVPGRFCSRILVAKSHGCPARTAISAAAVTLNRRRGSLLECIYLCLNRLIHFDQRWPGAVRAFAWQFVSGIDPHFAAGCDLSCGMIEHVRWSFGENAVSLRIAVRA